MQSNFNMVQNNPTTITVIDKSQYKYMYTVH